MQEKPQENILREVWKAEEVIFLYFLSMVAQGYLKLYALQFQVGRRILFCVG